MVFIVLRGFVYLGFFFRGGRVGSPVKPWLLGCFLFGYGVLLKQHFNCSYAKEIAGENHEIPIKCSLINIGVSHGVGGKKSVYCDSAMSYECFCL